MTDRLTKTLRRLIEDPSATDACVNGLRQMAKGESHMFEVVRAAPSKPLTKPAYNSFNDLRTERDQLQAEVDEFRECHTRLQRIYVKETTELKAANEKLLVETFDLKAKLRRATAEVDRMTPKPDGCRDGFKKAYATIAKVIQTGDVTRSDIVATTGWSEATVRRRLNEMLASGQVVARGYPARHWLAETYCASMVDPEDGDDMTVEVFRVRVRNVAAQKVTDARAMLLDCNDVPNNLSDREWRLATYLADHWYLFTEPLKNAIDVAFDSREGAELFEREWHGYAS